MVTINDLIEKAFSEGYEYAYEERYFAEDEESSKNSHKVHLSDIKSHRGMGRAALIGDGAGLVGGYAGKKKAEKLEDEGLSDEEIRKGAAKHGAKIGAIAGTALPAAILLTKGSKKLGKSLQNDWGGLKFWKKNSVRNKIARGLQKPADFFHNLSFGKGKLDERIKDGVKAAAVTSVATGALGGYLGAKKNTEKRIQERRELEERVDKRLNK